MSISYVCLLIRVVIQKYLDLTKVGQSILCIVKRKTWEQTLAIQNFREWCHALSFRDRVFLYLHSYLSNIPAGATKYHPFVCVRYGRNVFKFSQVSELRQQGTVSGKSRILGVIFNIQETEKLLSTYQKQEKHAMCKWFSFIWGLILGERKSV